MTRLRARVAERLKGAQNTYAMLTTFNEIDMTNLMQLRSVYKASPMRQHCRSQNPWLLESLNISTTKYVPMYRTQKCNIPYLLQMLLRHFPFLCSRQAQVPDYAD